MPVKGGQPAPPFISIAMAFPHKPLFPFLILFALTSVSGLKDSEILLKFKASLSDAAELANWSTNTSPCNGDLSNWKGVICVGGAVWGLQLERMGLKGTIDVQTLQDMPVLRTISFMNNSFEGPMPSFKKFVSMRSIYLSNNHFSGQIPDDAFQGMLKLAKVYLSQNEFTGPIPSSLANLPKLLELRLEDNKFTGSLPKFQQNFTLFNVSNNQLQGQIPDALAKMGVTSFAGNKDLCGSPLSPCKTEAVSTGSNIKPPISNNTTNETNRKDPSLASVIIVIIVAAVALAAIIAAAIILINRRRQELPNLSIETPPPSKVEIKTAFKQGAQQNQQDSPDQSSTCKKCDSAKLAFVRDDVERFDLPDLLKASAEILGSGCFGSSYKAALSTGVVMVVKRYKQMNNVGKEEFHEHMRRLGRLRHPNLSPLIAYYYRKEEKLLVSEFVEKGSLCALLHGRKKEGQASLSWATRLKIVKGVAKGLSYLYKELPSIIAAHGHLKSSNILINKCYEPLISDYGLVPVINQENAFELMAAYKSPEYLQLGRITRKTDVWCMGILIIEILTAKFPQTFLARGKRNGEENLAEWVKSIPEEEWMNQVMDKDIRGTRNSEGEMRKLLKVGLSCSEEDVEQRLDLKTVVERINEVQEKDNEDDFYTSHASDHGHKNTISSNGRSDDFTVS